MKSDISIENIERVIEKLEMQEQLRLMEKLAHLLAKNNLNAQKKLNWDELYGLGKGLWNGEDAQEYINRYREERE